MKIHLSLSLWLLLLSGESAIAREKWKITSLEWPPFCGDQLEENGIAIKMLKEALKKEGIDLTVEFYPWTRAIETAKQPDYVGYYPAWKEEVLSQFDRSIEIFTSPVGFAENVNRPLQWKTLSDLEGKTIGVVQSYGNNEEFNELVRRKVIKTEVAQEDLTNIRKVGSGRIDGAFIDINNLNYVLKNDAREFHSVVRANPRVLEVKGLYIALNRKFANKQAGEIIKRAVKRNKTSEQIQKFLKKN